MLDASCGATERPKFLLAESGDGLLHCWCMQNCGSLRGSVPKLEKKIQLLHSESDDRSVSLL